MKADFIKEFVLKNLFAVISLAIGLLSICGSLAFTFLYKCEECEICEAGNFSDDTDLESSVESTSNLRVDVKGSVKKPGVYSLDEDSTVQDAIDAAGGLSSSGVTSNINLSKRLSDEMVIYVFSKSEIKKQESSNQVVCEIPKCECETVVVGDTLNPSLSESNSKNNESSSLDQSNSKKVSINTGTLTDLMTLDGVGESKAQKIIEYREANGKFEKLEDLQKVSGIGTAMYEKIKDKITL